MSFIQEFSNPLNYPIRMDPDDSTWVSQMNLKNWHSLCLSIPMYLSPSENDPSFGKPEFMKRPIQSFILDALIFDSLVVPVNGLWSSRLCHFRGPFDRMLQKGRKSFFDCRTRLLRYFSAQFVLFHPRVSPSIT